MMASAIQRPSNPVASVQAAILRESDGILHAFSTRHGGVSRPPFGTLNLGQRVGDDPAAVEENRRRFFGAFDIGLGQVIRARQVHGNGVLRVDTPLTERPGFPHCLAEERADYDALITDIPGLALAVSTADCLPILIHDPVHRAVAAVHAGWRGTAKRIASQAVGAMRDAYGTNPADCRAAIGPGIRRCCFEVDAAVTEKIAAALPNWESHVTANRPGHWLLNLAGVNRSLMVVAGLLPDRIEDVGLCTSCRSDLFFSHRAEKGRTGRMMNFILLTTEVRQGQGQGQRRGSTGKAPEVFPDIAVGLRCRRSSTGGNHVDQAVTHVQGVRDYGLSAVSQSSRVHAGGSFARPRTLGRRRRRSRRSGDGPGAASGEEREIQHF